MLIRSVKIVNEALKISLNLRNNCWLLYAQKAQTAGISEIPALIYGLRGGRKFQIVDYTNTVLLKSSPGYNQPVSRAKNLFPDPLVGDRTHALKVGMVS